MRAVDRRVAPWLPLAFQTWNASQRQEEPANCPPLLTSRWRIWTCGSLPLKTAVSSDTRTLRSVSSHTGNVLTCDSWWHQNGKYLFTSTSVLETNDTNIYHIRLVAIELYFKWILFLPCFSKRSVQPVCSVEPLRYHYGRSLHSLLSQSQLRRMVHLQWLQVRLNAATVLMHFTSWSHMEAGDAPHLQLHPLDCICDWNLEAVNMYLHAEYTWFVTHSTLQHSLKTTVVTMAEISGVWMSVLMTELADNPTSSFITTHSTSLTLPESHSSYHRSHVLPHSCSVPL